MLIGVVFTSFSLPKDIRANEMGSGSIEINKEPDLEIELEDEEKVIEPFETNKTINWTVKKNTSKRTAVFHKKKGTKITINLFVSNISMVKVGIIDCNGRKTSVNASSHVNETFTVSKTSDYRVFVDNASGSSIRVKGFYNK